MQSVFLKTLFAFYLCFGASVGQRKRVKATSIVNDPRFKDQWYLGQLSDKFRGRHNNILSAWEQGASGKGVSIAVLDNGVQMDHPDLQDNIDITTSFNYLDKELLPLPNPSSPKSGHGTRMTGIIAMKANNKKCGIGIAFNSKISAIRIIGRQMKVSAHADAHSHLPQKIDIYSISYGPYDNGRIIQRYQRLTMMAIQRGVKFGRNGLGSIYVKPSGNGGPNGDHCGADGTINTIYTIAVAAAARDHKHPYFAETCASILTSVYTQHSDNYYEDQIDVVTTGVNSTCINTNGGSSTATAMTSGMIALALSANKKLTWRDVKYLIVASSERNGLKGNWTVNGAGLSVSHRYGFGVLNAGRMVQLAKRWKKVPKIQICYTPYMVGSNPVRVTVSKIPERVSLKYEIRGCPSLHILEHVSVVTNVRFTKRGDISIYVKSPKGTTSQLLGRRPNDVSARPYIRWEFASVHFWGERVNGKWEVIFEFSGEGKGTISYTYLQFHGISVQQRTRRRWRQN